MKINEIMQESVFDTLKTAGQRVRQGVGKAYNTVVQPQARQQRMAQAAASQGMTPAQLRTQNVASFTGDLAKTIGQASSGQSYFKDATPTIPKKTIPAGATVDTEFGTFRYTAQGWVSQSGQVQKDPQLITHLINKYYQETGNDIQTTTTSVKPQPISVGGQTINPNDPKYATLMKQLQQAQKTEV